MQSSRDRQPRSTLDSVFVIKLVVGVAVFVGALVLIRQSSNWTQPAPVPPPVSNQFQRHPGDQYRAVALQLYQYSTGRLSYLKHIDELADLGVNTVMLVGHGSQENASSSTIYLDPAAMPTYEQWREIINKCRERGLRVILMPTVQLTSPRGSEWRGRIKPNDWNQWWERYRHMIRFCTRICVDNQVELFIIGSELVSTERERERWTDLIAEVRQTYKGKIAYSANWDHYENLSFIDELDYIGMTSYYSLIKPPIPGRAPTVEELVKAWKPHRDKILAFHQRKGKPIVFTEVGYASQTGITSDPWNYYIFRDTQNGINKATPIGLEEQANAFVAFLEVFGHEPAVKGILFWEWGEGGLADPGYSPRGKPAADVLRRWLNSHRTTNEGTVPPPIGPGSPASAPLPIPIPEPATVPASAPAVDAMSAPATAASIEAASTATTSPLPTTTGAP